MEPNAQRRAGFLEDRPRQRVNVIAALVASVSRAPFDPIVLACAFALAADSDATGEALLFDLLKAGVVGRKLFFKLQKRVAKLFGDYLAAIHAGTMPERHLVVKG